ncbi:MAG: serine hydrolase domain-containing protein, partial [Luminiphilus sp.]
PMTTDALFRIFSMTKPITTVAAMMLYEEGYFHLNDPVAKYLPELANLKIYHQGELVPVGRAITIEQLMTHTAGLTYGWANDHPVELAYQESAMQYSDNLDDFLSKLSKLPLRFTPGERYHYSIATDVLGALVERLSGETLETFLSTRLFQPLGMEDTFFNVPEDKLDRVVPNHGWNPETNSLGPLPTLYQMPIQGVTLFSGGGGLISSARDYLIFCEMLRQGGSYEGVRILSPKTVEFMTIDHLTAEVRNKGATEYPAQHLYPGQSFGLGFGVITDPGQTGVISSLGAYSWGGAANTKFWIDPEEDLIAIFMTQVINAPFGDQLRFDMKVATYQAITELGSQH